MSSQPIEDHSTLKKKQKELGLKNDQLARLIGKTTRTVVHYRTGTLDIPPDVWRLLSFCLWLREEHPTAWEEGKNRFFPQDRSPSKKEEGSSTV